ncbi:MAG: DUF1134 domain-containing protein [Hyphomicrobiaceae bacterium]
MPKPSIFRTLVSCALPLALATAALAQDPRSWSQPQPYVTAPPPDFGKPAPGGSGYLGSQTDGRTGAVNDAYRPPPPSSSYQPPPTAQRYGGQGGSGAGNDVYVLPPHQRQDGANEVYRPPPRTAPQPYDNSYADNRRGYGEPYAPPPRNYRSDNRYQGDNRYGPDGPPHDERRTYSQNEIIDTGHRFFGSVSQGLASAVEYVFKQAGRPNGYILGEDAGGAFVAGLRYGEGTLYTKDAGNHKVYWQGPSLGYDFGGEGSKTMVLVYNLRDPSEIYHRFGGVQGSAYLVGGVSVQFQKRGDVVLAPIRSGVGLRFGANVGYLKYTRRPTWNPF